MVRTQTCSNLSVYFQVIRTDLVRNTPGVEVTQPGEKEKIQAVSEQFNRFQMMNFNEHHHCLRGTHLKTQGVSSKFTPITLMKHY
jgi:hypothetical protein